MESDDTEGSEKCEIEFEKVGIQRFSQSKSGSEPLEEKGQIWRGEARAGHTHRKINKHTHAQTWIQILGHKHRQIHKNTQTKNMGQIYKRGQIRAGHA